ncbi:DUF4199 domain-containing protein [Arenibacter sp. TNZ]|jgi:predicted neutral ceramidase superfamily lipid hydrolase|uniref:DUF4199 domain-containing protein n=1 Tax=Arenibacter TaxID=178469 RepID=UPI000CD40C30|nr:MULTISPECIES: DUF4199 domain-containing protein [Arenibacter]MCM4171129.1 DUF4199 domain-containing protein [Arenibacter sp. TNZ]
MSKFRIEIKWAVIFALATLLWMVFEKSMGWHDVLIAKQAIYTNFFAIIAIAVFVLALLDKRKIDFNGKMSWKQGFISGIFLSVIIAVLSPLTQYITNTFITPEYFPNIIKFAVDSGKMSQEAAESYFSLKSYVLQSFFGALTMGIVTSAIVAFFVKKQ